MSETPEKLKLMNESPDARIVEAMKLLNSRIRFVDGENRIIALFGAINGQSRSIELVPHNGNRLGEINFSIESGLPKTRWISPESFGFQIEDTNYVLYHSKEAYQAYQ